MLSQRQALYEEFKRDPGHFRNLAKSRGLPLSAVLQVEAPTGDKYSPRSALHDLMMRDGLRVESDLNHPASTIGEFFTEPHRAELLYSYLDDVYERAFWKRTPSSSGVRAVPGGESGAAQSEFTENEMWRPYHDTPLMERKKIAPQVRIEDLIARVETIAEDLIRETDYDVPTVDETMSNIAEGTEIPVVQMRLRSETSSMKKVGIGLEITDEFMTNPTRVSAVRIWVERVATTHEITLVREAVRTLKVQGTANGAVDIAQTLDDIIKVNTEFEEPYMMTLLITSKAQARAWIKANVDAGMSGANFLSYPSGRFAGVFAGIQLVNMTSAPTRLAYVTDPTTGALASGEMLGIDDRAAIVLYRQTRGSVNERERIARRQVEARYLTERYGFVIEDDNPIRLFT